MKTAGMYLLFVIVTCIFFAAGILLPQWLIAYADQGMIGKVRSESLEIPETVSGADTLMIDKISLLKDYGEVVTQVPLKMGIKLDMDSANTKFLEEVNELMRLGLLPQTEQTDKAESDGRDDKTALSTEVSLYVRNDAPSVNAVLWSVIWREGDFWGNFYMDDDTGKILQFIVYLPEKFSDPDKDDMEAWAKYLGLKVKDTDKQTENILLKDMLRDKYSKIYNSVSCCELVFQDKVLPYIFYSFKGGYGFGYNDITTDQILKYRVVSDKEQAVITEKRKP